MLESSLEHVRHDFHVTMRVRVEALAGRDNILVHHSERAKPCVLGVAIRVERKRVVRIQPTVVSVSPLVCSSDRDHARLLLITRCRNCTWARSEEGLGRKGGNKE